MTERLVCIVCPVGCELEVEAGAGDVVVNGNRCPKGYDYGRTEAVDPRRTLTTALPVIGGAEPLVPVRVDGVPRAMLMEAMGRLRTMSATAPIHLGGTLGLMALRGLELRVVATASVAKRT